MPFEFWINPEIKAVSEEKSYFWEGCLSVPGMRGWVERPRLVKASGLTAEELRNTLVKKLAHYIKKPQLDVSILQFNSSPVYVLGAVMRPQVLKLNFKSTSLADALSLSGGINESVANPQGVFVIRKIPGNKKLATRIL